MQRQSVRYTERQLEKGATKASLCASAALCQLVTQQRRRHYAEKTAGRASQGHARDAHSGSCCRAHRCSHTEQGQNKQQRTTQDRGAPGEQWRGSGATFASFLTALCGWTHSVAMLQHTCHSVETPQATCTTANSATTL